MNDFDEMEKMFADSMIVESEEKKEEVIEVQTDEEIEAELGEVEEEPVFEEPEPVEPEPELDTSWKAPKKESTVFYGTAGKRIEDEATKERLKSYFDESMLDLEAFNDFLTYVSSLEDKAQRDLILKVSNDNLRNNPRKQYEFLLRHTFPFVVARMEMKLSQLSQTMSETISDWAVQITKPLSATIKYNNDLIRAIQDAEGSSIEALEVKTNASIKKLEVALDKIIEREKEISNGHDKKAQAEITKVQAEIKLWKDTCESALKKAQADVINARSKQIDDILGSAVDTAVAELMTKMKDVMLNRESPLKKFLFYAGASFAGIWLFAVIAKHFPGIVI